MPSVHPDKRHPPPFPRPKPLVGEFRTAPPELYEPPPVPRIVRVVDVHPRSLDPVRHNGVCLRKARKEPPVECRSKTQHVRVRALPHSTNLPVNPLRPPAPRRQPTQHGHDDYPWLELPELVLAERLQQVRGER